MVSGSISEKSKCSVKKRKLTSSVWEHMVKIRQGDEDLAKCTKCGKLLKASSKSGTSTLRHHITSCLAKNQPSIDVALQKQQQIQIGNKNGEVSLTTFSFDQEIAKKQLARAIVLHEYPLSVVDHIGFRDFMSSVQPLFKMCSRNTIKKEIFNIFDKEKKILVEALERNTGRVAITTDMWTSNQKKGYMSITAHYVDDNWVLQSRILRFLYVPAPHTADVLAEKLLEGLCEWNLESKLTTITVDNCSTNDLMVTKVVNKLSPDCLLGGKYVHMRCGAHILNLIVKDGLSEIDGVISNVRDSVSYWSCTPSRVEKFEELARSLKISCFKKLVLDCRTRWNSTYLMLQVAIEYIDVFTKLARREKSFTCAPSEGDWNLAKLICEKLEIFYDTTEYFSGTQYPTSQSFFIRTCEIKDSLCEWMKSENRTIISMAKKMNDKFDKYWNVVHVMMTISAILDPRYKLTAIEFYYEKRYGEEAWLELDKIKGVMYDLIRQYQSKGSGGDSKTYEILSHPGGGGGKSRKEKSEKVKALESYINSKSVVGNVKSELDHYLDEECLRIDLSIDFDILSWWKTSGIKYPTLQLVARDLLAIPVSTVASESVFSTGGRVVSSHRSSLHPKTLDVLMCSQSWLWSQRAGISVIPSTNKNTTEEDDGTPISSVTD